MQVGAHDNQLVEASEAQSPQQIWEAQLKYNSKEIKVCVNIFQHMGKDAVEFAKKQSYSVIENAGQY